MRKAIVGQPGPAERNLANHDRDQQSGGPTRPAALVARASIYLTRLLACGGRARAGARRPPRPPHEAAMVRIPIHK